MAKEEKAERSSNKIELLSTYIARIEKALKKVEHKHVILSTDLSEEPLGHGNIKRLPILWPLYEHSMFYITTLKAGTRVQTHQHAENVFRYVIDGAIDVTVKEKTYRVKKGMWIAVRANTNYSLATRSNPTSATLLSAYQYQCKVT
jgi:quercetin dioxygenase-like cupin family protein